MKWLWRLIKYFFIGSLLMIILVVVLLLLDTDYQANVVLDLDQLPPSKLAYQPTSDSSFYKALKVKYGNNKILPQGYELQTLIALSYYPELKDVPIEFVMHEAYIPLSSRPDPITVLFPWKQRKYLVVISTASTKEFDSILLKNLPYNGQIGVIGHELAHTVYYLDKSAWQITKIALDYARSTNYQKQFERATDLRTIKHGLGYQLRSMSEYIHHKIDQNKALEKEIGMLKENYFSPKEIELQIKRIPKLYGHINQ